MSLPRFICFIGIDGSGKTTLAKKLQDKLVALGLKVHYTWGAYDIILLRPIFEIAYGLLVRKNPYDAYMSYHNSIKGLSKNRLFKTVYIGSTLLEYFTQIFLKVKLHLFAGRTLICDRYIYDTIINMAVNFGMSPDECCRLIRKLLSFCPCPDVVVYIDLPEEIAFKRKSDIPSIDYIRLRRTYYLNIANEFASHILDGTKSPQELEKEIESILLG